MVFTCYNQNAKKLVFGCFFWSSPFYWTIRATKNRLQSPVYPKKAKKLDQTGPLNTTWKRLGYINLSLPWLQSLDDFPSSSFWSTTNLWKILLNCQHVNYCFYTYAFSFWICSSCERVTLPFSFSILASAKQYITYCHLIYFMILIQYFWYLLMLTILEKWNFTFL